MQHPTCDGFRAKHRLRQFARRRGLPLALALLSVAAIAAPPRDRLTLLVPDNAAMNSWQVQVWTDSAAEEGIRLDVVTDTALRAMGNTSAAKIAGLIVPDSAHIQASDATIAAIKQFAFLGGKLMLVYDAGALTDAGFYPLTGNSRFADMLGIDYLFWNNGLGASTMVGFGPVIGTRSRLESLSLPPGKHMAYTAPGSLAMATTSTAFVPTSRLDPGGTLAMRQAVRERGAGEIEDGSNKLRRQRLRSLREVLGIGVEPSAPLRFQRRIEAASKSRDHHHRDRVVRPVDDVHAVISADGRKSIETTAPVADMSLRTISGYAYGPLNYFSYVTTGSFPGTVYLSSPEHGLVAGARPYGSGEVLFVNMPIGYFKAIGTDSAPLHGFLGLFARDHVGVPTLSAQPRGVGGLIYNWHIDDDDDLTVNTRMLLDDTSVLKSGPFSLHLTAGPDVITFGDGNGMNLPANAPGQELVRRLANLNLKGKKSRDDDDDDDDDDSRGGKKPSRHEFGSHGGWIHDYWGVMANEANVPDLTPLLVKNFEAIENVLGRKLREYSSPQGNTPTWAVRWIERRGVVAMYTVGDGGAGAVRSWRDGARLTDKMWSIPVTPQGKYATWEEFEEFGISDLVSGQWLLDLQSFVVNRRTNRMFYSHPPGVADHLQTVNVLLDRAGQLQKKDRFRFYTMAQMADFSQRRIGTTWNTSNVSGATLFSASNPSSLADIAWLLPKNRFDQPRIVEGRAKVSADQNSWVVTADSGTTLKFITMER